MAVKAIFFDVYGTLISTGTGSVDACRAILGRLESAIPPAAFYRRWKAIHRELTLKTRTEGFLTEQEIFKRGLQALYQVYGLKGNADADVQPMFSSLYGRKAFEDTLPALEALAGQYQIYLASNTDTAPLLDNLQQNNIKADGVYTSEALRCYKPDPDFYAELLARTGLSASETVFVGDSPNEDAAGPKAAGMYSVLLDRQKKFQQESGAADAWIFSLAELPPLLNLFKRS